MKRMGLMIAVAAGLVAAPVLALGQLDPTMSPNPGPMNPQSPQNQNMPLNQPNYPTQTGGTNVNQTTSMRDSLGAPGQTGQQMRDEQFMRKATEAGIADIKMSELALQKGSPAVKELAQRMIDDHNIINKDMGSVADSLSVTLPRKMSKEQQAEYDKLSKLSGKDFDAEYVNILARSHFTDLHFFHAEAAGASDTALQEEVVRALRTMHDHLGLIKDTAKTEDITLPPPPPRTQRPTPTTASR